MHSIFVSPDWLLLPMLYIQYMYAFFFSTHFTVRNMFHEDNINEDQLKNLFGTNNYEDIYYMIMNNVKMNNQIGGF